MSDLLEIRRLFHELADNLGALKEVHANDRQTVARIEIAEERAKRGAELASRASASQS